ncbi:pseudouridine synthase [Lichenibacterium minor]|uniref:Pseudouridine synthase n=1 Tax=Lichenibacterium minor TaxID=2316528 RepID=A0A4V1RUR8_9HYPH|nr:pseudouridine synthase [Lichenibacterium minor]RYC32104.1 pseudouridine synthase [Lichenibacterium minor]
MTDTTKPPNRPTAPRPRPFGRDESRRQDDRRDDARRGGDKPRPRDDAGARGDKPRGGAGLTRGAEPAPPKDDARIAKVMARAGLCSRRDAEGWIAAGRVAVNGAVIDSPALNVKPGDRITVDGEPLPERDQTRLFLFHKPRGLVTTARDPEGRPTIFDNLPGGLPRVVSVGRLDINTEGLMLLTNDGGLARVLELPATGWLRRYRVRANGEIDQARLDALKAGVTIDGVDYAGIEATLDRVQGANAWLTMGLREGKNREIKRVLESLGLAVTRLIRISFGPFQLGELAEGAVENIPTRVLRDQLGPALAAQAGVDLEAREEPAPRRGVRGEDGAAPARPSRSTPAAPRPHVGALRAAREEEAGEGRKRVVRGATADRRGRAVAVERVIPVAGGDRGESRNARRFAAEKTDYVAGRQKTRADADGARPSRGGFAAKAGRAGFAGKPQRGAYGDGQRSPYGDEAAERPRGPRAGRFDPKTRGDRAEGFASAPRGERAGGFGERPRDGADRPRGTGFAARPRSPRPDDGAGRPRGERPGPFGAKPRGGAFAERPRGARADEDFSRTRGGTGPRRDGAEAPRGERSGGEARTGKPNGRPGGFSSERPATGRNKPGGARPFGDKPRGAGPGGGRPRGGAPGGGKPSGKPPRGRP